jgi:hypothetical protein
MSPIYLEQLTPTKRQRGNLGWRRVFLNEGRVYKANVGTFDEPKIDMQPQILADEREPTNLLNASKLRILADEALSDLHQEHVAQ